MLTVRPATVDDAQTILDFIVELAVYEKARHEVVTDVVGVRESLFGVHAKAKALMCCRGHEPVGYAVYFYSYSTWLGRNGLYLEDVYVSPPHRGKGAGKAMLRYLAQIAVQEKCGRLEWSVLDWNTPAIEFYDALGALPQSEWIRYRLTGEALRALAGS
jgi:GNAT superfamily N-acetyltransferase